jgi:NADH:ubiquinone oxidoreductase subunit
MISLLFTRGLRTPSADEYKNLYSECQKKGSLIRKERFVILEKGEEMGEY